MTMSTSIVSIIMIFMVGRLSADMPMPTDILTSSDIPESSTSVDLSGKNFTRIDPHAFDNATGLINLNLAHNKITVLTPSIFAKLKNLKTLHLNDNELTERTIDAFNGLGNLNFLNLSGNRLSLQLKSDFFNGLSNSVCIAIQRNPGLARIQGDVFGYSSRNYSYEDVQSYGESRSIESHEKLHYCITNGLLSNMYYVDDDEQGKLESPKISGCRTISLTSDIVSGLDVTFRGEQLNSITDNSFVNITGIGYLDMSFNEFNNTEFMKNLPSSLEILRLDYNKIRALKAGCFSKLPNLRTVALGGNKMTYIAPGTFDNTNIMGIDLRFNQLTSIQKGVFTGLASLKSLDLRGNRLTTIQADAFDIPHLTNLRLGNNEIVTIPPQVFRNLPELEVLDISGTSINSLEFGKFPESLKKSDSVIYIADIEMIAAGTLAQCNLTTL